MEKEALLVNFKEQNGFHFGEDHFEGEENEYEQKIAWLRQQLIEKTSELEFCKAQLQYLQDQTEERELDEKQEEESLSQVQCLKLIIERKEKLVQEQKQTIEQLERQCQLLMSQLHPNGNIESITTSDNSSNNADLEAKIKRLQQQLQ